jgi:hypothetical protein
VIRLTKVQVLAEFVVDPGEGEDLEPGVFGPVSLTPKEWQQFNLAKAIEKGIEDA